VETTCSFFTIGDDGVPQLRSGGPDPHLGFTITYAQENPTASILTRCVEERKRTTEKRRDIATEKSEAYHRATTWERKSLKSKRTEKFDERKRNGGV